MSSYSMRPSTIGREVQMEEQVREAENTSCPQLSVEIGTQSRSEYVYLSANRFSIAWENGIQMPFTFFVFAWHWKTDLNFAFCFSFSHHFEKRIWVSFYFRFSFSRHFEKRISISFIVFALLLIEKKGKFTCFHLHKKWMPRSTPRVCPGTSIDWTGAEIRLSSHAKTTNEIQICFSITSHTKMKNEIQILYPKWCKNEKRNSYPFVKVMRKRKTKFLSVFQSDERTKNKKQNSNLFFNVMQKRKTKNGNGIWMPFSHAIEKRLALRCTHCNATRQHRRSIKTELWTKISVRFMSSYIW